MARYTEDLVISWSSSILGCMDGAKRSFTIRILSFLLVIGLELSLSRLPELTTSVARSHFVHKITVIEHG